MALNYADYDGTVIAPDVANPFGMFKDDPNGTKMNSKTFNDIFQFFYKMMAGAGITYNHDLDNATNGFQLYEALLNTFSYPIGQASLSLAGTYYFVTHQIMRFL